MIFPQAPAHLLFLEKTRIQRRMLLNFVLIVVAIVVVAVEEVQACEQISAAAEMRWKRGGRDGANP